MNAEWRPVVGYEGIYEVSNLGLIRSLDRTVVYRDGRRRIQKGITLKGTAIGEYGHLGVRLYKSGISRPFQIHRVVAEAFLGTCPPGMECCHNNGDGSDNRASNLRWGTSRDNKQDVVRHGRHHYAHRSHCTNGHEFTEENTLYRKRHNGTRLCRKCAAESRKLRKKERKAA